MWAKGCSGGWQAGYPADCWAGYRAGYRAAAWTRIATALAIDTPDKDIDSLRREAAACLGDFLGNEPLVRTEPDSRPLIFSWFPDSQRVAVALGSKPDLYS